MHPILALDPLAYEIRGMYRFADLKPEGTLADELRPIWPENPRLLMVAADPEADTYTENLALDLASALVKAGLPVGEVRVLQQETAEVAAQLVPGADVIVLADGEAEDADEKRSAFFAEIDFPSLLGSAKEDAPLIALSQAALDAATV